jgi:mRNA interferase MazF
MQGKVVLIQFPFDDLSASKVRPAYGLTPAIGPYQHIIFALITSRIPSSPLITDIVLHPDHPDFTHSGLQKASTLRLDHLVTLRRSLVRRELGSLLPETQAAISKILCTLLRPSNS